MHDMMILDFVSGLAGFWVILWLENIIVCVCLFCHSDASSSGIGSRMKQVFRSSLLRESGRESGRARDVDEMTTAIGQVEQSYMRLKESSLQGITMNQYEESRQPWPD